MRLQGGRMKSVTTAGRCARVIIACGLVLAAAGCGDSTPVGIAGPTTGVLQVTVSTSGADLTTNGYTVSVDSGAGQPVSVNGEVSLAGLTAGSHRVSLYGAQIGRASCRERVEISVVGGGMTKEKSSSVLW